MADILIRGMEMPHSCMCCPLNHGEKRPEYGWTIVCKYSNGVVRPELTDYITRLPTCGISELPPHGDLIDRDAILHEDVLHYIDTINSSFGSYVKFSDLVRGAPVIVPSNKEETE